MVQGTFYYQVMSRLFEYCTNVRLVLIFRSSWVTNERVHGFRIVEIAELEIRMCHNWEILCSLWNDNCSNEIGGADDNYYEITVKLQTHIMKSFNLHPTHDVKAVNSRFFVDDDFPMF